MRPRHVAPLLLAVLFATAAAGALTASQDGAERYVFGPNDQIRFLLETADPSDYTLEVVNGSWTTTESMTALGREVNSSIYRYEANFTRQAGVPIGDAVAHAVNGSGVRWTSFLFHVATSTPRVFDTAQTPLFPPPHSGVVIVANVSDAENDIDTIALEHNGTMYAMEIVEQGEHWTAYRQRVTVGDAGTEDYTVHVEDADGNTAEHDGEIEVVADASPADTEDVGVGVRIPPDCRVTIRNFFTPGLDFVLGYNDTGMITADITNLGTLDANATVTLNVTYEDEEEWTRGEPPGNVTRTYNASSFLLSADVLSNASDTYMKQFTGDRVGWHTARMAANASCTAPSGEQLHHHTTSNDTFVVLNATGGGSDLGNDTTNETAPADANETGEESNQTTPADADETGEESDQVLEGDEPEPGQTPVPEPEPEPTPVLSLDIEEMQDSYTAAREQYAPINLSIENVWEEPIEGVTITPQVGQLGDGWEARSASLGAIASGDSTNRTVYIRPPVGAEPGLYRLPVVASTADRRLDSERITFRVLQTVFGSQVQIQEVPRQVNIVANRSTTIPVLIRNVGSTELRNVTAELRNADGVSSVQVEEVRNVSVNGTAAVLLNVTGGATTRSTNATLIVRTDEGAYSFADIRMDVVEEDTGIVPAAYRFPLVATVWTVLLVLYAVLTRRFDLDAWYVKMPFVVLILGEATIILYIAAEYYGLSQTLLPF